MAGERSMINGVQEIKMEDFIDGLTEHEQNQFKRDLFMKQQDMLDRRDEIEFSEKKKRWTAVINTTVTTLGTAATIVFGSKFAKPLLKTLLH